MFLLCCMCVQCAIWFICKHFLSLRTRVKKMMDDSEAANTDYTLSADSTDNHDTRDTHNTISTVGATGTITTSKTASDTGPSSGDGKINGTVSMGASVALREPLLEDL